jgi:hypothetical protein
VGWGGGGFGDAEGEERGEGLVVGQQGAAAGAASLVRLEASGLVRLETPERAGSHELLERLVVVGSRGVEIAWQAHVRRSPRAD